MRRVMVKIPWSAALVTVYLTTYGQLGFTQEVNDSSRLGAVAVMPATTQETLQTIAPDTSKAIFRQFMSDNPNAREHKIGLVSEAFAEDPSNPALKLERMWVSDKATLLEIVGLVRSGQPNSAAISPETLRLINLKTQQAAKLIASEGVMQVKDQRGGKALILKQGDTMYLLMESVDDLQAMSLSYTGWDGHEERYFDRIDPRFRERYDASYKLASAPNATPEQMKDFLVEFAKEDPDKYAPQVFLSLINRMRAQNSFEGYYQSYLLLKDPVDAKAAVKLARTDEHRTKLENVAVATLADKGRLLDLDFQLNAGNTTSGEGGCFMACRYNFTASRNVNGTVTLRAKTIGTPIKLRLGSYKVTLLTELILPRWGLQQSAWVGSFDRRSDDVRNGFVTVELRPPSYAATVPVSFGSVNVAFFQRGSMGGYTAYWADGEARATVKFKSMELIK